jgi:hypothetical protein
MTRLFCLLATLLLAVPALAAEDADAHAGHHPPAATEDASGQPDHDVVSAAHLGQNMETMRDVMAKIRQTADPAERKRLLGVHMLAMEEQIKVIRAVYANAGGHEHGAAGESKERGAKDKDKGMMGKETMGAGMMMKKMHKQMEQRMDALEQLLQQFIEHEAVEEAE